MTWRGCTVLSLGGADESSHSVLNELIWDTTLNDVLPQNSLHPDMLMIWRAYQVTSISDKAYSTLR